MFCLLLVLTCWSPCPAILLLCLLLCLPVIHGSVPPDGTTKLAVTTGTAHTASLNIWGDPLLGSTKPQGNSDRQGRQQQGTQHI